MGKRVIVESGRDRRALVADAGWSQLSLVSVLAGVLVAYGAFALLAGIAGGILEAADADTDITARWDDRGVAAGLVVAGLLLLSYLFGGYVAGRMARRAGLVQGAAVFVFGVVVVAAVAVAIRALAGTDTVVESLRDLGLPTTRDEWDDVGSVAGLASLAGALIGAVLGGVLGERWHAKLLSRAIDPDVGAEADARRTAELAAAEARVRRTESQERVDTASLRGRRDTPDADPRPEATTGRGTDGRGWYRRDPDLDDAPGTRQETPARDPSDRRVTTEGGTVEAQGDAGPERPLRRPPRGTDQSR
jgi:membrane associated rhomboid family serine protease